MAAAAVEVKGKTGQVPALLEGKLLKRGSVSWKARHFVVSENALSYYAKAGDSKSRGDIAITGKSRVSDFPKRTHAFQVITGDKSLTVCANSDEECGRWQDVIKQRIEAAAKIESEAHPGGSTGGGEGGSNPNMKVVSAAGQDFEMDSKYEMIKPIGHGAYGVVISAIDHEFRAKVAIKKIPNTFEDLVDAKRIVREIRLLRHFNHENVIKVLDLFTPQPHDNFSDVYIVSDLMETDLHRVIYSRQQLTNEHIQFFLYQMMCGLKYIHSAAVLHRDLKPSNILLNANCDLKLCDFGLSRGLKEAEGSTGANLTEYVVTRWYRAPEIMLSCSTYTTAIDVWSVGCIFGEMLARKPMFPGSDYIHQLKLIMKVVGTPTKSELWFVTNHKANRFVLSLPKYETEDLTRSFPNADHDGLDLLGKMLLLDPSKRISVDDALAHPYLAEVRDVECEAVAPGPVDWGDVETCELNRENLQRLLVEDFVAQIDVRANMTAADLGGSAPDS